MLKYFKKPRALLCQGAMSDIAQPMVGARLAGPQTTAEVESDSILPIVNPASTVALDSGGVKNPNSKRQSKKRAKLRLAQEKKAQNAEMKDANSEAVTPTSILIQDSHGADVDASVHEEKCRAGVNIDLTNERYSAFGGDWGAE